MFSQKLEQIDARNLTHWQRASGRSDFAKLGTVWQIPHQTAVIRQLCFAVNLGRVSEVSVVLFRARKLSVGPAGCISIGLES